MSIIFDSHCHPQLPQYDPVKSFDRAQDNGASNDREEMLQRAFDAGVKMICVGTDLETSKQGIELAQKYDGIWATVGLHPNDISDTFDVMIYHNMLRNKKVVAIGEVGLDYYRTPEPEKQDKQKEVLKQFIDLAVKYDKPLIIHCRDAAKGTTGEAHKDLLNILKSYFVNHKSSSRGVAHSFTGTIDQAKKYIEKGFYLGFNGIITFPPSRKATEGQVPGMYDEIVKYVPLENILLETDAPFLSPEPYRGQRNEPARVIEVAKKVAELKGESLEKVIETTTKNCQKLFGIDIK